MKINILSYVLLPLFMGACSNSTKLTLTPETIYDSHGLQVLSKSSNQKKHTTILLFANPAAIKTAAAGNTVHQPGEDYRLVTWKQAGHPLWFGSNINGAVESIERITTSKSTDGSVKINYQLVQGAHLKNVNQQDRIKYILDQEPLEFP